MLTILLNIRSFSGELKDLLLLIEGGAVEVKSTNSNLYSSGFV